MKAILFQAPSLQVFLTAQKSRKLWLSEETHSNPPPNTMVSTGNDWQLCKVFTISSTQAVMQRHSFFRSLKHQTTTRKGDKGQRHSQAAEEQLLGHRAGMWQVQLSSFNVQRFF